MRVIVIGPLSLEPVSGLSAHRAPLIKPLRNMVRFYAGDEIDFEAQLILDVKRKHRLRVGRRRRTCAATGLAELGQNDRRCSRNPSQTVLQL